MGLTPDMIRFVPISLRINPNSAYFHFGLGESYCVSGQHEDALVHLGEAVRLSPAGC